MKSRICLTILALAAAMAAHAQLMPDSTVQITAYWQPGDRMTYDFSSTECVVEREDTLRLRSYTDIRTMEVLKATPSRYTLRITNSRHFERDSVAQMIFSLEQREGLNVPLVIETTLDGELLCVVNATEIIDAAHKLVDRAAEDLYDSLPQRMRDTTPQWEWRNTLERWLKPEASTTHTIEDIERIFFFHGVRFRRDAEYERSERLRVPLSDVEAETVTTFWADPATDESSAMLHTHSESEAAEALRKTAAARPGALLLGGILSPAQITAAEVTMESFMGEEIHFATGWPLQAYWSSRLEATTPDGRDIMIHIRKQLTRRDDDTLTPITAEGATSSVTE